MTELWSRLRAILSGRDPVATDRLSAPVNPAAVAALEAKVGRALPSDLKASLLIHNGDEAVPGFVFGQFGQLLSAQLMAETYAGQCEHGDYQASYASPNVLKVYGPVRPMFWNKAWVPFMGDYKLSYAIDLDPPRGGMSGQVILAVPENNELFRVADSYRSFFEQLVNELHAGITPSPDRWLAPLRNQGSSRGNEPRR